MRSCLHCALRRALEVEGPALAARRLTVLLGRSDPVWLPVAGGRVYRRLRRLFQEVLARADAGSPVRLAVIVQDGKGHVELTAAFRREGSWTVRMVEFPRYVGAALPGGFVEGLPVAG